jgi:hypothetical protein
MAKLLLANFAESDEQERKLNIEMELHKTEYVQKNWTGSG